MAVLLNSNLIAQRAISGLDRTTQSLTNSFTRLSSGLRINKASDDAAGLAIASGLSTKSRVYNQAIRNGNDAISLLNIAQGTVQNLSDVVIRLKELATQGSSGTLGTSQRRSIDTEAYSLTREYNRLIQDTKFNGLSILSPELGDIITQLGFGALESIKFNAAEQLRRTVGNGSFASSISAVGNASLSEISGDFNNDGILDFISFKDGTTGSVYCGNGDGTFRNTGNVTPAVGNTTVSLAVGDFNGDGIQDLAIGESNGHVEIFKSNGDGTVTLLSDTNTGGAGIVTLRAGDFNRDGKIDLVANSADTTLRTFLGNGNGTFQSALTFTLANGQSSLALGQIGDFNGDGILDYVGTYAVGGSNEILQGNGDGTFRSVGAISMGKNINFVFADFNRDGLDDAISATGVMYVSNGDGTFRSQTAFTTTGANNPRTGDMNGDGYLDIVTVDGSGNARTYFGNGDGTFGSSILSSVGTLTAMNLGDFNGDGVTDLLLGIGGNTNLYLGNTTQVTTIQHLNLTTQEGSRSALSILDAALERIGKHLGVLGSSMSRLNVALNTLQATSDNYRSAEGRIIDADIAQETATLVKNQILQNAITGILGQANQQPALALKLLQFG